MPSIMPFGRPSYHPKMLIATLLFAYSQGIFSGRKIEKMMIENLDYAVPNRTVGIGFNLSPVNKQTI